MEKSLSIANQLRHFHQGTFNTEDLSTLALAGWATFTCKSSALVRKTQILFRRLERVAFCGFFDLNENTAVLKNIHENGKNYEVIEIRNLNTGCGLCTIFYKHPETGLAGVHNMEGDSLASGTWEEIKEFLMGSELKVPSTKEITLPLYEGIDSDPDTEYKPKAKKAKVTKKSKKATAAEAAAEAVEVVLENEELDTAITEG